MVSKQVNQLCLMVIDVMIKGREVGERDASHVVVREVLSTKGICGQRPE